MNHHLTTDPAKVTLNLSLGGSPAAVTMSSLLISIDGGPTSKPKASAGTTTPGHLASEHLRPTLVSFDSGGRPTADGAGHMCGNISAASLAKTPIPEQLAGSGLFNCNEKFTSSNSLLDAIARGCTNLLAGKLIGATPKPDKEDPSIAPAGSGPPYTFVLTGNQVTGCKGKAGDTVDLAGCLNDAAYSSAFLFATGRVIVK
jgi:hypothetical protein